jgi:hypothetical protein
MWPPVPPVVIITVPLIPRIRGAAADSGSGRPHSRP